MNMAMKAGVKETGASHPKHIDLHGNVFELPDFTMKQIYDAIPAHCFQPLILRSFAYVGRDYLYLGSLMYFTYIFVPMIPSVYLRAVCYALYTALAGLIMTGIWTLGHESGHGTLSKSKTLNNTLGFILHPSIIIPYYSWKITHSHHHKAVGDLQHDMAFVPHSREYWAKEKFGEDTDVLTMEHLSEDMPIVLLYHCVIHQLFGFPLHLLDNLSGQKGQRGFPYHSYYWFGKDSVLFKESELWSVFLSDVGLLLMASLLYLVAKSLGWWTVLIFYGVPYLWLNHWLVLITYLQHTDPTLPHFTHSQWSFTRGATATIDRDFGFIDTHFFHNMIGTHVVHHLVSSIPFYHTQEATEAIKKVMGRHYHADRNTHMLAAFWNNRRDCQFVEESSGMDGSGIFMFRNLHGRGVQPRNLAAGEALTTWSGSMPASM